MKECVNVFNEYITTQTLSSLVFEDCDGSVFENDFTNKLNIKISVC